MNKLWCYYRESSHASIPQHFFHTIRLDPLFCRIIAYRATGVIISTILSPLLVSESLFEFTITNCDSRTTCSFSSWIGTCCFHCNVAVGIAISNIVGNQLVHKRSILQGIPTFVIVTMTGKQVLLVVVLVRMKCAVSANNATITQKKKKKRHVTF
jgi:hypothetical protein